MPLRAVEDTFIHRMEDKIFPWGFAGTVLLVVIADFALIWVLF
jgi:hypothetical protein